VVDGVLFKELIQALFSVFSYLTSGRIVYTCDTIINNDFQFKKTEVYLKKKEFSGGPLDQRA